MYMVKLSGTCYGGNTCCDDGICGEGEGDCDSDNDCLPGLICGKNNCIGSTFTSSDDCCVKGKEENR